MSPVTEYSVPGEDLLTVPGFRFHSPVVSLLTSGPEISWSRVWGVGGWDGSRVGYMSSVSRSCHGPPVDCKVTVITHKCGSIDKHVC